jgi:P4 family phage/plasmid primase-like protien
VIHLIKIEELTAESILDEEVFKNLYSIKDEFTRQQTRNKLEEKAKSLGGKELKDKFNKLCKAYETRFQKPKSDGPKEKLPIYNTDGVDISKWHETDKDGKPISIIDDYLVEYILNNYHMFVIAKVPYIYDHGVYRIDESETMLKAIIRSLVFRKLIKIDLIERIYRLIITTNSIQKSYDDLNNYPKHWINFRNGFFDVREWKMYPHSPDYYSINQMPHEFNPDAEVYGEVTQKFIEYTIPDESDRQMMWEFYGYCMTVDCSLQKFLIFKGQGGTGKSKLIHIVEEMVGYENRSSISMQQLNERFYPAMLLGKTLNACADIPSKAMEAVDGIKKATGEDSLFAERKGKDGFSFNSYAKLIFSANEIPINIEEKSEALYRRMMIIKVERKPETINVSLQSELDKEIDYSIMTACKALREMYQRGKFSESTNSRSNVKELHMEADSVTAFLFEKTKDVKDKYTKSATLFEEYKKYCEELEISKGRLSLKGFHRSMKNKGYEKVRRADGEYYMNIVLANNSLPEDENGFVSTAGINQEELPFQ